MTTMSTVDEDEEEQEFPSEVNMRLDLDDTSIASDCSTEGGSLPDDGQSLADTALRESLAQNESRAVFRLRVLVILVLFLAAIAVSIVVFYITRNAGVAEIETQYEGSAEKITESFTNIVKQKLGAISSVGVANIAHGVDHFRTWPLVTLSSFQQRSATARSLSGAIFLSTAPFVNGSKRVEWEQYVATDEDNWIEDGFAYQKELGLDGFEPTPAKSWAEKLANSSSHSIFYIDSNKEVHDETGPGPFLPVWQTSPILHRDFINQNLFHSAYAVDARKCLETEQVIIGGLNRAPAGGPDHPDSYTSFYSTLLSIDAEETVEYQGDPMSNVFLPIFSSFRTDRKPVAVLFAVINWGAYFKNVLPPNVNGLHAVLENSCDEAFTYRIDGEEVINVGPGDLHDRKYDYLMHSATFEGIPNIADGTKYGLDLTQDKCPVTLKVYPSATFLALDKTAPLVVTFAVAMVFVFTVCMFLIYDRLVERRQNIVLSRATTSAAIVSSLFPKNVRDRLMQERVASSKEPTTNLNTPRIRLKSFLSDISEDKAGGEAGLHPIADFFPETTVMFADIAGFTAWSSTREPVQVFVLLQTLYQAFDVLAKKLTVWKVETIGDSYVAVTGLPQPQEKHAVIMARFAGFCFLRMRDIVRDLEVMLGPETADLGMRFGLHSGPVTAGVLRGERARFQLFGDTVNTAARMESTGRTNLIQCSQSTADLLIKAGKAHWLKARTGMVEAKGKGKMKTYWISPFAKRRGSTSSGDTGGESGADTARRMPFKQDHDVLAVKRERLVEWICELLLDHMKKIEANRITASSRSLARSSGSSRSLVGKMKLVAAKGRIVLDEVAECIALPKFNPQVANDSIHRGSIKIDSVVGLQLHRLVSMIAGFYGDRPFHNFEHACHVTMSVNKLLKRIVAPDVELKENCRGKIASQIHDYTHGINSDPLTQFAIVFGALIHDADHSGVPNIQLIKEDRERAEYYRNKSIAEQHSFDICWDLLMADEFQELRQSLFNTREELSRFRQVLVNVVMATDIFDKELGLLRKTRWIKAFSEDSAYSPNVNNLRATIVIEHIIQASDVSHTMQHWHVYRKWNKKLFHEMHQAFCSGRMAIDPSTSWYESELGFFDNYIIPLAKKLKECKIFGVSSDEYLNYALMNRAEWKDKGQEIVEELKQEFNVDVERCHL